MTTEKNIFEPTLKFSQKTSVSNVNVSNYNIVVCFKPGSCIHVKIRLYSSLWKGTTHFSHTKILSIVLMLSFTRLFDGHTVNSSVTCLLYFLNICSDIICNI